MKKINLNWADVITDWFDINNQDHLNAYSHLHGKHGQWPDGFYDNMPEEVKDAIGRSSGTWSLILMNKLADAYINKHLQK